MGDTTGKKPSICIDLKKGRVRIHKDTLYLLGCPQYIELLVNPKNKGFIVRSADNGKNSHPVRLKKCGRDKKCYELYSRNFIREINRVADLMEKENSYRITGNLNTDRTAAFFCLDNASLIEAGKDTELYA